jgi:hypothetical protein
LKSNTKAILKALVNAIENEFDRRQLENEDRESSLKKRNIHKIWYFLIIFISFNP